MLEGCLWLEDMRCQLEKLWTKLCNCAENQERCHYKQKQNDGESSILSLSHSLTLSFFLSLSLVLFFFQNVGTSATNAISGWDHAQSARKQKRLNNNSCAHLCLKSIEFPEGMEQF
jgi:hypothetical protein